MVDKDKELTVKNDNFITKMFAKIRSIFGKGKNKQLNEDTIVNVTNEETKRKDSLENIATSRYEGNINPYDEKRRVFKIFNDVKEGKTKIKDLSAVDVILINKLLRDEIEILKSNKLT